MAPPNTPEMCLELSIGTLGPGDARGSITGGREPKSWVAVTDYFSFLTFDEIRMT